MNARKIAKFLLHPGQSLSERAARSGMWLLGTNLTGRMIALVRSIILARLLFPEDFGTVGIAYIVMGAMAIFFVTGFNRALVQKKGNIKDYLDTAWVVQVAKGVVLGLIVFGVAPLAASFYENPSILPITRVIAISCIFDGFRNIGLVYFTKELDFRKLFIYESCSILADVVVSVVAAFIMRNAWAIVFGSLAANLVKLISSYVLHPYRPRFHFQMARARELFTFGKWIYASTLVVFLSTQADSAFLGKILGITALGFYQLAYSYAGIPGRVFGIIQRVAFPTYSKVQDNKQVLRDAYLKILRLVSCLTIPVAAGIALVAPGFTQIILGDKWMPMVPALQILSIILMIKTTTDTCAALFNAKGRPDLNFKMVLLRVVSLAALVYPLTRLWEMEGTALAVGLSVVISATIWVWGTVKLGVLRPVDFYKNLVPPVLGTAIMAGVIYALGLAINQLEPAGFVISIIVGIIVYFGFVYLTRNLLGYAFFNDVRDIFNALKLGTSSKPDTEGAPYDTSY